MKYSHLKAQSIIILMDNPTKNRLISKKLLIADSIFNKMS
jgi:hypothetical protein